MIALNSTTEIDDKQKWVHVTLEVDGDECQFNHVAPTGLEGTDLQKFIESKEDSYRFDILRDMYPTCRDQKKTDLETMLEWIKDGCNLRDKDGQFTGKAEKVEWINTHPGPDPLTIEFENLKARIETLEKLI